MKPGKMLALVTRTVLNKAVSVVSFIKIGVEKMEKEKRKDTNKKVWRELVFVVIGKPNTTTI
jgi:hypothetical protein